MKKIKLNRQNYSAVQTAGPQICSSHWIFFQDSAGPVLGEGLPSAKSWVRFLIPYNLTCWAVSRLQSSDQVELKQYPTTHL